MTVAGSAVAGCNFRECGVRAMQLTVVGRVSEAPVRPDGLGKLRQLEMSGGDGASSVDQEKDAPALGTASSG